MNPLEQALVLAGAVALAGLGAGLVRARGSAWLPRMFVLGAAAALLASVIDPAVQDSVVRVPAVRMVANGPVPAAVASELAARLPGGLDLVEASSDPGELAMALRGPQAALAPARAFLWVQPLRAAARSEDAPLEPMAPAMPPSLGIPPCALLTVAPPLPFAPDQVRVRASGVAVRGRPLALELSGLPAGWSGDLSVAERGGSDLGRAAITGADRGVCARVDVLPAAAGHLRVTVRAGSGERWFSAEGEIAVSPAPPLLVAGVGGEPLAAALRAQGFVAESAAALPDDLARFQALVLTQALPLAEQERVRDYADGGGGVFLVGGPDGGSLPIAGEPAVVLSPVALAARPVPARTGAAGEGRASEAPTAAPVVPPNQEPDKPAVGETEGAATPDRERKEVERRSVAMVFVIDRSQSMLEPATPGGPTRMDYVRSSAQATASRLMPGDELAIVTFGNRDAEEVELPLTSATAFEPVHRALAGLAARYHEGTYVDSALARAALVLAASRSAIKHVVVITDGLIEDLVLATTRAKSIRESGVSISMIRFGAGQEDLTATKQCRAFTQFGGGAYLQSTDTREVPALVSSEVKRVLASTGRPTAGEGEEAPVSGAPAPSAVPPPVAAKQQDSVPARETPAVEVASRLAVRAIERSPLLAPWPEHELPSLLGVLAVVARPEARVLLAAGDEGRPLLAFKNYGLGRVAAWTADLSGEWSREWRAARAFPAWLAQWVGALAPPTAAADAADVLRERAMQPMGPTPAEVAALQAVCGGSLRPWNEVEAPAPVRFASSRRIGDLTALAAALLLLLLAAVEFGVVRGARVQAG